jgi:hypothetical protein
MSTSKNSMKPTSQSSEDGVNGDKSPRKGAPQFIQYRLSEDEVEQARQSADSYSDVAELLNQFIVEGFKFSTSHDSYGGGVQCFITPASPQAANAGYTLSARAPTLHAAIAVLCWKHYTLFEGAWPKEDSGTRGGGWG